MFSKKTALNRLNFQKALLRVFGLKGLGLGGPRQGSGMKKGTELCPTCHKKLENCICK